jgi:glycosyltransferase involved in cell wall biosynthesis
MPSRENVSIIIPAYNSESQLPRAIESCLAQTRLPKEIIVIDDGSTDRTFQVAKKFGEMVRVFRQENSGQGVARNKGVLEARGDIIGFLDADDELLPCMIDVLVGVLNRFPEAGAASGAHYRKVGKQVVRRPPEGCVLVHGQGEAIVSDFFRVYANYCIMWTGALLVRRSVMQSVGGFSTMRKLGQDVATWQEIAGQFSWVYVDRPVSVYHCTEGSVTQGTWNAADGWWLYDEIEMKKKVLPELWDGYRVYRQATVIRIVPGLLLQGDINRARQLLRNTPCDSRTISWFITKLIVCFPKIWRFLFNIASRCKRIVGNVNSQKTGMTGLKMSSNSIRLAHVMGMQSTKYGGVERFLVALAEECRRRGYVFHCAYEDRPASESFVADLERAGAFVFILPPSHKLVPFSWKVYRWLTCNKINIVHVHFNPAALLTLVASKVANIPSLWTIHGEVQHGASGAAMSWKSKILARLRLALVSKTLADSDRVRVQWQEAFGSSGIETHYLGVRPSSVGKAKVAMRREFGLSDSNIVIACVAFHAPVKGVDILLRAIGLLAPKYPQLRLLQIGISATPDNPSDTQELKALAAALGISDRIVWMGNRNDVEDILGCADLYCQPSRHEALGLAILEAMNAGLPIVATRVGGIPEAICAGETGLLVNPESFQEMAVAIDRLLNDDGLRYKMGRKGRQRAGRKFDLNRQISDLIDMYETMLVSRQ